MKITIYTITECAFSKQEKEYLSSHGLQFEEKNLETNREFLTEMLAVGNNFAGTPVTKIEKDDGQVVVLKGFTASEFDKALALAPAAQVQPVKPVEPVKSVEISQSQSEQLQTAPVAEVAPAPAPTTAAEVVPAPASVVDSGEAKPVADPAMTSVLNTLEQQAAPPAMPPVEVTPPSVAAPVVDPAAPVIPEPQF